MSRFVRSSKFRHVFGTACKPEATYQNLRVSKTAWDTNKVFGNNKFIAVIWEARGGGSFGVLKQGNFGKASASPPLVCGHKANVLDLAFSPFNDHIVGSVSEDGTAKIWEIPEGGLTENMTEPVQNLIGHRRKAGTIDFNPCADNVAATSSLDYTVKIWDVSKGEAKNSVEGFAGQIQSVAWSWDGASMAVASKDKKCRVVDPRTNSVVQEFDSTPGVKGARVIYLGSKDRLLVQGFSRTSERVFLIVDPRNTAAPLAKKTIDTAAGMLMPFYDEDTSMLFLAGKGDGNIRYFEMVEDKPYFHYLSEYKSSTPQLGAAMLPKTACDTAECEVVRMLKADVSGISTIHFKVPRKSDLFQPDLFPETRGHEPANTSEAWFGGANGTPANINLEDGFKPKPKPQFQAAKKEVKKEKELTSLEMKKKITELEGRVAYLEAESAKKDIRIKELSA
jgi:coronin-1B/1C/6